MAGVPVQVAASAPRHDSARPASPRPPAGTVRLSARDVTVAAGGATLVQRVSLDVVAGGLLAVVGPNGAGKSTLLAALAGDRRCTGTVTYDGDPVAHLAPGVLARRRAVMLQDHAVAFPFTVREVVAMGRAPWHRRAESAQDEPLVAWALEATATAHLEHRAVSTLSGGERARVVLARTLAQDAPVLLLDEPTAALDPPHQERTLALLAGRARAGDAVVVVLHDLTAAAAHADAVALLSRGRLLDCGPPDRVVAAGALHDAYGHAMGVFPHPTTGRPVVLPGRCG